MRRPPLRTRQRQVLDAIYRLGEASAADVRREVGVDISYSAVRSVLRCLEEKNLVRHRERDLRYVYSPVVPRSRAARSALAYVVKTYFGGDRREAMRVLRQMK